MNREEKDIVRDALVALDVFHTLEENWAAEAEKVWLEKRAALEELIK